MDILKVHVSFRCEKWLRFVSMEGTKNCMSYIYAFNALSLESQKKHSIILLNTFKSPNESAQWMLYVNILQPNHVFSLSFHGSGSLFSFYPNKYIFKILWRI